MELTVQLAKILQHYQSVQALMLEAKTFKEFLGIDKDLESLEYQIDVLKLRIGEQEDG